MEPRPCGFFYDVVGKLATTIVDVWRLVETFVRWCGASNPCIWWCLCCNVWGCWLVAILLAVLATVILVIFILVAVLMVVICWIVCLIAVVLLAIGRSQTPNCFAPRSEPPPPAPPADPVPPPPVDTPAG